MNPLTRNAITELIFMRHAPAPVDLALVLGCPSISNMDPAIALYKEGLTSRILITGAGSLIDGQPEWKFYQEHALKAGIPSDALTIEPFAKNTLENFQFSKVLIDQELNSGTINKIAICAKPVHTRRAFMTARSIFPDHVTYLMVSPEDLRDVQSQDWWTYSRGRERVFGELRRIAEYALKGDISEK